MRMRDVIAMHQAAPPPLACTLIHIWRYTGTYVATHLLMRHCPLQSEPHGGLPIMRATPPFAHWIVQFGISTYDERFS